MHIFYLRIFSEEIKQKKHFRSFDIPIVFNAVETPTISFTTCILKLLTILNIVTVILLISIDNNFYRGKQFKYFVKCPKSMLVKVKCRSPLLQIFNRFLCFVKSLNQHPTPSSNLPSDRNPTPRGWYRLR